MTPSRRLMRPADVAGYLGQPTSWVRLRLADGTIPGARKVCGRWMIAQDDVDAWVDAGRPEREERAPYAPPPRVMSRTVDRAA